MNEFKPIRHTRRETPGAKIGMSDVISDDDALKGTRIEPIMLKIGMTDTALRFIADKTGNVYEYITALRILRGMTQDTVGAEAGYSGIEPRALARIEHGARTPPWERFQTILETLTNGPHTKQFQRGEALYVDNVLKIIRAATARGDKRYATKHMELLPASYSQYRIDKLIDPHAFAKEEKPVWANDILPIETQGEYLRCMRRVLGWKPEDIGETLGRGRRIITQMEEQQHQYSVLDTRAALELIQLYRDEQERRFVSPKDGIKRFFDEEAFTKLGRNVMTHAERQANRLEMVEGAERG